MCIIIMLSVYKKRKSTYLGHEEKILCFCSYNFVAVIVVVCLKIAESF